MGWLQMFTLNRVKIKGGIEDEVNSFFFPSIFDAVVLPRAHPLPPLGLVDHALTRHNDP